MTRPALTVIAGRPVSRLEPPQRPEGPPNRREGRDLEWLLPIIMIASSTLVGLIVWGLSWLPW